MTSVKKVKTDNSIFNAQVIPPAELQDYLTLNEGEELSFTHKYYEDRNVDLRIIEVQRQDGSLPYSVVIHEFSKRGLKYFFEALYTAQSWASSDDYTNKKYSFDTYFCKELWQTFGLEGEFDPSTIEHDLEHQYILYRRPLQEAVERTYGLLSNCTHESYHYMTKETIEDLFAKHRENPLQPTNLNVVNSNSNDSMCDVDDKV